jgi:hypothetical protein
MRTRKQKGRPRARGNMKKQLPNPPRDILEELHTGYIEHLKWLSACEEILQAYLRRSDVTTKKP